MYDNRHDLVLVRVRHVLLCPLTGVNDVTGKREHLVGSLLELHRLGALPRVPRRVPVNE